jgi:crotonobetainyl-CoA:carnitine CoA-transferase CaiB-like acyl-CoA transferase
MVDPGGNPKRWRNPEGRMDQSSQARLPLNGITVLDITHARAGPTCVRHLADWGANVIKIEPPVKEREEATGNRHGFDFQNLHRNARSTST